MVWDAAKWVLVASPIIAGGLAVCCALVFARSGQRPAEGETREVAGDLRAGVGRFSATVSILAVVLLCVMGAGFALAVAKVGASGPAQILAFAIGAFGALLSAWIEPAAAGRGSAGLVSMMDSDPGAALTQALRRASASGLFPFGLALLAVAAARPLSGGQSDEVLLALAIGAACAAALVHGAGAIARGAPRGSALWLPEFFGAGLYAVVIVTLAAAMSMARHHFEHVAGAPHYPLAVASAAAIAALIGMLLVRSRSGASLFGAVNPALAVSLLIAAGLTYLLRRALLPEANMFSTVAIGLGCAFVLSLIAQLRPVDGGEGAAAGVEMVVLAALVAAMALGIAFHLAGGFGVGLCAVGLVAAGPFAGMLAVFGARLWQMRALSEASEPDAQLRYEMADIAEAAQNARLAAGGMMSALVLLAAAALFRLAMENSALEGLDIDQAYVFSALVLGATAPFLLGGLALRGAQGIARHWGRTPSRAAGAVGAGWRGTWRMFWLIVLAAGLPVAVAFFWRLPAAVGLLVGLAAAALFALFAIYLSDSPHGVSGLLGACAAPLILLSALVAVRFGDAAAALSVDMARAAKIKGLVIVVAALALWLLIEALYRWATSRGRPQSEAAS